MCDCNCKDRTKDWEEYAKEITDNFNASMEDGKKRLNDIPPKVPQTEPPKFTHPQDATLDEEIDILQAVSQRQKEAEEALKAAATSKDMFERKLDVIRNKLNYFSYDISQLVNKAITHDVKQEYVEELYSYLLELNQYVSAALSKLEPKICEGAEDVDDDEVEDVEDNYAKYETTSHLWDKLKELLETVEASKNEDEEKLEDALTYKGCTEDRHRRSQMALVQYATVFNRMLEELKFGVSPEDRLNRLQWMLSLSAKHL